MKTHSNLIEGLTRNALEYLVLPLITIDEYESKISDKRAIVVGFFVNEENPANDLSNFIDRSSNPILDTEVSPAPTPDGNFVVFVEIQRDENFTKVLLDLLSEIENLCEVTDWEFQCPESSDPVELTKENIEKLIILNQDDVLELPDDDEDVVDNDNDLVAEASFWKNSSTDSYEINNDQITFYKNNNLYKYVIENYIYDSSLSIDLNNSSARIMQSILGPAYSVFGTNCGLIVEHQNKAKLLKTG